MSNETPMMIQYHKIKDQYPDAFLFYRLGDFYELFEDDALKASRLLEITLTTRNKKSKNPIPMCGVPHHAAQDYIKTLIKMGYKVAICEQMEDPKLAKGMVKREVIQLLTPGTYIDESANQQLTNHYLVSLTTNRKPSYLSDPKIDVMTKEVTLFGISAVDVSTGEWSATVVDRDQLAIEIASLHPQEIVCEPEFEESFQKIFPDLFFSTIVPKKSELLPPIESNELPVLEENPKILLDKANRLIMSYLIETQKKQLSHLQAITYYEPTSYLQMSQETKSHLELITSVRHKKEGALIAILDETQTAMGSRLLKQWLEKPLLKQATIESRQERVSLLLNNFLERTALSEYLHQVYDLERLVTKLAMGTIRPRDYQQLSKSLSIVPLITETLNAIDKDQIFAEENVSTNVSIQVQQLIDAAIDDDPPITFKNGGVIRDGYNEQLDHYRDVLKNGQQWIADLQQKERELTQAKSLKVGYNKVFGYYIEISKAQAQQVDTSRFDRKQTLANAERYITPELKEIEQEILEAQENALVLEHELYEQLRKDIMPFREKLQQTAKSIATIDVIQSLAKVAEDNDYCKPSLSLHDRTLELSHSRHPVVEKVLGPGEFVSNDVSLGGDHRVEIITGPNMAGKSTYMRQVALITIMAQIGSYVPAKAAKLPIVTKLFTRIGAADDLYSGKSTFMVEMMETQYALKHADQYSLILFDEIGRGTATYDGMALAQAIIEFIVEQIPAHVLFSTHYHELTDLDQQFEAIKNVHIEAIESGNDIVFSHLIKPGAADKSYGVHVARLAEMDERVILRAEVILKELETNAQKLKETMDDDHSDLAGNKKSSLRNSTKNNNEEYSSEIAVDYQKLKARVEAIDVLNYSPLEVVTLLADLQNEVKNDGENQRT